MKNEKKSPSARLSESPKVRESLSWRVSRKVTARKRGRPFSLLFWTPLKVRTADVNSHTGSLSLCACVCAWVLPFSLFFWAKSQDAVLARDWFFVDKELHTVVVEQVTVHAMRHVAVRAEQSHVRLQHVRSGLAFQFIYPTAIGPLLNSSKRRRRRG